MVTTSDHAFMPNEARIVNLLRQYGASTLDDVSQLAGVDWVTAFSIIDRLSRAGVVVLTRHGLDYRVSLERNT